MYHIDCKKDPIKNIHTFKFHSLNYKLIFWPMKMCKVHDMALVLKSLKTPALGCLLPDWQLLGTRCSRWWWCLVMKFPLVGGLLHDSIFDHEPVPVPKSVWSGMMDVFGFFL